MLMDLSNSRGPLSTVLFSFPCSAATVHNKNKQKKVVFHMALKFLLPSVRLKPIPGSLFGSGCKKRSLIAMY